MHLYPVHACSDNTVSAKILKTPVKLLASFLSIYLSNDFGEGTHSLGK